MDVQQKAPILRSIRAYCLECMSGSRKLVDECDADHCGVHKYRRTILDGHEARTADFIDVCDGVANRCVNCSSGTFKDCTLTACPLNKRIKTVIEVVYDRKKAS